jgi:hypothetical protein
MSAAINHVVPRIAPSRAAVSVTLRTTGRRVPALALAVAERPSISSPSTSRHKKRIAESA